MAANYIYEVVRKNSIHLQAGIMRMNLFRVRVKLNTKFYAIIGSNSVGKQVLIKSYSNLDQNRTIKGT